MSRSLSSKTREGRGLILLSSSLLTLTSVTACTAVVPSVSLPEPTSEANLQRHDIPVAIFIEDGAYVYSVNDVVIQKDELNLKITEAIAGNENARILLYADENVPIGYTVEVLDLALEQGIKVNVATDESE